jgi:hypothetical protein
MLTAGNDCVCLDATECVFDQIRKARQEGSWEALRTTHKKEKKMVASDRKEEKE